MNRLISQVANEFWVCEKQTVRRWEGDIQSYKDASNHNSLLLYRAHVAKATTTFLPELVVEEKTLQ